jgi:ABC-type multidrug transport system ATPase subunit
MLCNLSVKEVLLHSARVKLPSNWSNKQINERVEEVLVLLRIKHIENSVIGDAVVRGIR